MKFLHPPPKKTGSCFFFSGQGRVNKKKRLDDKDPSLFVYTPHRVGEKLEHGTIQHAKQSIHGLTSTISNPESSRPPRIREEPHTNLETQFAPPRPVLP